MKGYGFIKDFKFLYKNFGFVVAAKVRLLPVIYSRLSSHSYAYYYHRAIISFFKNLLSDVIIKYRRLDESNVKVQALTQNDIIWVCWWQGKDQMPPLIKKCYEHLQHNSNGHPVCFISQDNFSNYVDIPLFLIEKLNKGLITITHFTDILRVSLLAKHGGFWIDGGIWVTKPINNIIGHSFFSLKQEYNGDSLVSKCRWSGGCMATGKNNFLYSFLRESLIKYWDINNVPINYLFLDYLIDIAYNEFDHIKELIDSVDNSSPSLHLMKLIFNEEYHEDKMNEILNNNAFLSLSWKKTYEMYTQNKKQTYYNFFMNQSI